MSESVQEYNKSLRTVTTGRDKREDAQIMMSANANWGEFLTPAPYCVALIGQLLIIASKIDFSIEKSAPADGFKYVDNPKSFQGSLVQLSNWAYNAFNTAHKNMGAITEHTGTFPSHITTIVKTLLQGSHEDVEDFVGAEMQTLQEATNECVKRASETEQAFMQVMFLSGELLQAGTVSQGANDEEIKRNQAAFNVATLQKQKMEEQNKVLKERSKKLEQTYQDANDMYKKAVDSVPSGWEILGMNVVEGLSGMVMSGLDLVMKQQIGGQGMAMVSMMNNGKEGQAGGNGASTIPSASPEARPDVDDAFTKSEVVLMQAITLDNITVSIVSKETKWLEIKDGVRSIEVQLKDVETKVVKTTVPGVTLGGLIDKMVKLCEDLSTQASQLGGTDNKTATEFRTKISDVKYEVQKFNSQGKVIGTTTPIQAPPLIPPTPPPTASSGKVSSAALESAQFKVDQAKMLLNNAREDYNKVTDKMDQSSDDLIKIVAKLSEIDLNKINFEEIRVVLRDSIKYLGLLREEWGKILMFFQMMSNIISITLRDKVKTFVKQAEVFEDRVLGGTKLSDFNKETILSASLEVGKVAFHVNNLSSTYVEISQEHIIPRIAGIGKIMGVKDDPRQMMDIKRQLDKDCIDSQEKIRAKVSQSKQEFQKTIAKRLRALESALTEKLPAIAPEAAESSRKAIESAQKLADAASKVSEKITQDEQAGKVDKLPNNKTINDAAKDVGVEYAW